MRAGGCILGARDITPAKSLCVSCDPLVNRHIPPVSIYLNAQDRVDDDTDRILDCVELPVQLGANVSTAAINPCGLEGEIPKIPNKRHNRYFFFPFRAA